MDEPDFTPEMAKQWREAVAETRRQLFGSISFVKDAPEAERKRMTHTDMAGYLNDVFEDWRGKTKENRKS